MTKRVLMTLFAAAFLLTGCEFNVGEIFQPKHGDEILFHREENCLRDGDVVGIFIDRPVLYRNVKASVKGKEILPANSLYWPSDMPDSAIRFMAVYPYDKEYDAGGTVAFTAAPDQSSDDAFRKSDLQIAQSEATIHNPYIIFDFAHQMSKIVVYLDCSADAAQSVTLEAVYPSVALDLDKRSVCANGDKIDILGHRADCETPGVCAYEFLLAPQTAEISMTVKAASREYQILCSSSLGLEAGNQYESSRICVLDPNKTKASTASFEQKEWSEVPDFVYGEAVPDGVEFTSATDFGVYSYYNGYATPVRCLEPLADQQSTIAKTGYKGYRIIGVLGDELFELMIKASSISNGGSYSANVATRNIDGLEKSFATSLKVVKVGSDRIYLTDEAAGLSYIIPSM